MLSDELFTDITRPIRDYLDRDDLLDLCVNRAGQVYLSTVGGWECFDNPEITNQWISRFIHAMSQASKQKTDARKPLLSASLISGERLQACLPPAATHATFTIRRPSDQSLSLDDFKSQGAFNTGNAKHQRDHVLHAKALYDAGDVYMCFRYAVQHRLNIIISGATGSGKTTLTKALIREIPDDERLIAIEDAEELEFRQDNVIRLLYSRDGSGTSTVTAKDLLLSCLRMKPDRILLSELRGDEAYYYLRNVNSGHPGSITSMHGESEREAIDQLIFMVKESNAGGGFSRDDLMDFIRKLVHIVVQWDRWKLAGAYFPGLED